MGWKVVQSHRVKARTGVATEVDKGQRIAIVDVDGGQVGDFFAFNRDDVGEYLSASHTRAFNSRMFPRPGQSFVSSRRRPMLQVLADTSPGYHDLLVAACDPPRYLQLGVEGWHASCADNLRQALEAIGRRTTHIPQPFNVFMRTPATHEGAIVWLLAESEAGTASRWRPSRTWSSSCPPARPSCPGSTPATSPTLSWRSPSGTQNRQPELPNRPPACQTEPRW